MTANTELLLSFCGIMAVAAVWGMWWVQAHLADMRSLVFKLTPSP